MAQDLIAKGIISVVFHWPERSKNWYYAHGGRLNPDDGTLEFPPTLREKALELMNKIEDVKAGRLKVDREMDELTMALGRCRGYGVVSWKYAFKGNLDSYRSRKRRKEREEDHWRQMMEQDLKNKTKRCR
jgi:D-mannonate dehydratase